MFYFFYVKLYCVAIYAEQLKLNQRGMAVQQGVWVLFFFRLYFA